MTSIISILKGDDVERRVMAIMMMNQWLSRSDRQHQSMNEILSKVISVIDYRFIIQMIQTEGGHSHRDDGYDNDDNNNDGSSSCSGSAVQLAGLTFMAHICMHASSTRGDTVDNYCIVTSGIHSNNNNETQMDIFIRGFMMHEDLIIVKYFTSTNTDIRCQCMNLMKIFHLSYNNNQKHAFVSSILKQYRTFCMQPQQQRQRYSYSKDGMKGTSPVTDNVNNDDRHADRSNIRSALEVLQLIVDVITTSQVQLSLPDENGGDGSINTSKRNNDNDNNLKSIIRLSTEESYVIQVLITASLCMGEGGGGDDGIASESNIRDNAMECCRDLLISTAVINPSWLSLSSTAIDVIPSIGTVDDTSTDSAIEKTRSSSSSSSSNSSSFSHFICSTIHNELHLLIDELLFLGSNGPATLRQEGNYYEHIPEDLSNRMPGAGLNGHDDDDDDNRHDDNGNDDVERQKDDVTETNYHHHHHHQTRINNDVMFFKSRVCRNMRMFIICLQMIDGIVNILLIDNNDDSQHGDGNTCGRIEASYQHIIQLKRCLYLIINELFQFIQDCSCIQYNKVVVDNSNGGNSDGRSNICKTSHDADNNTISNDIQSNTIHIINQNMNASNNNSNSNSCSSHSFFINHYMMTNMICCVVDTLNIFLLNDFENIFPLYVKCLPSILKMKSDDTRDMHDYIMSIEVYEDDLKHHLLKHIDNHDNIRDDGYLLFPRYEVILCLIDPLITMIEVCREGGSGGDASSDDQTQSVAIEMLHDQYPLLLPYLRRIINRVFDYLAYHSRSHYGCHQIDCDDKSVKSRISKNALPLSFTSDLCTLTQRIIIDRCRDIQFMLLLKLEGTELLQKALGVSAVEWNQLYSHCLDTRAILLHSLPNHPWNDNDKEEEGEESTSAIINTCTDNILQLSACIMTLLA